MTQPQHPDTTADDYEHGEWEPKAPDFDLDAPGTRKTVYATTLGWHDLHTPDNGINTIAAEAARLEQECGVKLHTLRYNGINHGYEPTFISENITDIVCLLATDEGGGINDDGELSLTNGTIVEVTL